MTTRNGRRVSVFLMVSFAVAVLAYPSYAKDGVETETLIKKITPPMAVIKAEEPVKDEWLIDCYYEPGAVYQGTRRGRWSELTNLFGYVHKNIRGYFSVSEYERFDDKDFIAAFGSYLNFKDSYVHMETGFGWLIDYMYKFKAIAEYGHKLYKTLYWQIGYEYRGYGTDDTHMIYPSLIYYFGDSYMSVNYGATCMEGHDTASFGAVKGSFAITKFLDWWAGVAFGERLYDILSLDAHEESGYILFTGATVKVYKGISCRAGYSYGQEDPKFIKHSLIFDLTVKF